MAEERQYNEAKIVFSRGSAVTVDIHMQNESGHKYYIFYENFLLKWIINLNVKCTTIKLLGNKIRENVNDLGYSGDFLGTRPPKT